MSSETTGMILHHCNEKARKRDSVPRRTERLNLLKHLARRLEEWESTLEARDSVGPTRSEMDWIVEDLKSYWTVIREHRSFDELSGD